MEILLLFAGGAYIQAVTGFAMGLLVMGGMGVLHLGSITQMAVVVSLLALLNNLLSLRGHCHQIARWELRWLALGLLPTVFLGVWLLERLESGNMSLLRQCLGTVILLGGLLLAFRPKPRSREAGAFSFLLAGAAGGVMGGLFSTAGPPIVYHLYRQPMSLEAIRATLFSIFIFASLIRILDVGLHGRITVEAWMLSALALPVVAVATLLGKRFPPPWSVVTMRRFAFFLLAGLGGGLIWAG